MTTFTPAVVVDPPGPRGPRYGLYSAASGPGILPPHGIAGGLVYEPVTCGSSDVVQVACSGTESGMSYDANDDLVSAKPFVVRATLQCGMAGKTAAQIDAKVRNRLMNGEQGSVEREVATILAGDAVSLSVLDTHIGDVVGELETYLYYTMEYGNVGCLHMPIRMASYVGDDLIFKDGNVYRTRLGTVVSFGAYPDDGTVYITGQVALWRSADIVTTPMDRASDWLANQYKVMAERDFAASYDCVCASAIFDWGAIS